MLSGVWPKKLLVDPDLEEMAMQHLRGVVVMPVKGRKPKAMISVFQDLFLGGRFEGFFL